MPVDESLIRAALPSNRNYFPILLSSTDLCLISTVAVSRIFSVAERLLQSPPPRSSDLVTPSISALKESN